MEPYIHVPYKKEFEPIVLPGENIAVAKSLDEMEWEYYRVKYVEPFFINYTTPTITNGSYSDVSIDDMEIGENEIAQIRMLLQTDGFEIEVRLPQAVAKYTTKNSIHRLDKWISDNYPHFTEMFYKSDTIPQLRVYNNSGADGTANIRIVGFRYVLERLPRQPEKYTVIYVNTVSSSNH